MNPKKKILIAGAGHGELPLVKAAKRLNLHVITSGNRPKDLAHAYADEVCLEDFSNREAMLALAKRKKIDFICAGCNDFSALSSAYVAEKLGLPGHDPFCVSVRLHHKDLYRAFANQIGLNTPKASSFLTAQEALSSLSERTFPVIIKPVDMSGGKGMGTLYDEENAEAFIQKALKTSRAGRIVIEDFIEGSRHGLSTFIRDGKVVFYFSDNEHYFHSPYLVSAASTPTTVTNDAIKLVVEEAEKIAKALNLVNGLFHIQFILRNDTPYIIEICRRSPGDLYIQFVEHSTHVPYPEWIVRSAMGWGGGTINQADPNGVYARHCVMSFHAGVVQNVTTSPAFQGEIIDELMWWEKGDVITDVLTHKLGIKFIRFKDVDMLWQQIERLQELIYVKVV